MASTTFVDGETLIEASWLNDVNAAVYTPGTIDAANVSNTPAGNIAATTVQAAINELDTEKQPLDTDLTAIAALTTAAYGRSLLETSSEATFKALVNLETGVDVQAYNANIPTAAPGTSGNMLISNGSTWISKSRSFAYSTTGTGGITSTGATRAVTATTPALDNTIPQNTEGDALLDVTISCNIGDIIQVFAYVPGSTTSALYTTLAIFVDSTANALAANTATSTGAGSTIFTSCETIFTATATSHTFKVRGGVNANTWNVNTTTSAATFGGVCAAYLTAQVVA